PEVFVIGDLATLNDENGKMLPGVAPVAMQEGEATAHNIGAELQGKPRKNFHYFSKGNLATIGRAAAVAEFGKIHISGFVDLPELSHGRRATDCCQVALAEVMKILARLAL